VIAVERRLGVAQRGHAEHLPVPVFPRGLAVQRRADRHTLRQPPARTLALQQLREEIPVATVQLLELLCRRSRAALVEHLDAQAYHRIFADLHI
jgi:hypothetical protein